MSKNIICVKKEKTKLYGNERELYMNGKQRITNIIQGKPVDRIPWTTLSDDITRTDMDDGYKNIPILDFYRKIGADILQFGNYGLPDSLHVSEPFKVVSDSVTSKWEHFQDGSVVHSRSFGGKSLKAAYKKSHPIKYPVETAEDMALLLEMTESYRVLPLGDYADYANRCSRCEAAIGQDGIYIPTLPPSPVQQLIEYECGLENFYYMLAEKTELTERVIDAMFAVNKRQYEITAEKSPFMAVIPVENTSTTLTSPKIYQKYSMPHIRAFSDIMHERGKKAIIHMCGHLHHLLGELKETGLDGIHALTPPTVGDCPFDTALDVLGEDLIIIGVLDSAIFHDPRANEESIRNCVMETITPRIRKSNFMLAIGTDGLKTDLWRLAAVREAMEKLC